MAIPTVCVMGGTGFVGRRIVRLLCKQGFAVRVPTRNRDKARQALGEFPVEVVAADVHDPVELAKLFEGVNVVINLVGILNESGVETFLHAHVQLADKVIETARAANVQRLLHMSALNASPTGPSAYLRTKGEAEVRVQASGLRATTFRPSVIFGAGDNFLTLFARLAKWAPVIPLACADARFQPVWVEDVAEAFMRALNDDATVGLRYNLCGPKVYRLRELVAFAAARRKRHPLILPLPDSIAYLQASVLEWLPLKLMTRDNFHSMRLDSVCDGEFPFGLAPARLEDIGPQYLG